MVSTGSSKYAISAMGFPCQQSSKSMALLYRPGKLLLDSVVSLPRMQEKSGTLELLVLSRPSWNTSVFCDHGFRIMYVVEPHNIVIYVEHVLIN